MQSRFGTNPEIVTFVLRLVVAEGGKVSPGAYPARSQRRRHEEPR